ncbi:peptide/nickel transport system substrate-binding protein [Variovorax paradoxus]|uniref:peptide ABC transporter substrate-binding protein n=1 Tax=Variovorax paradoxus TaxID=34073 RepID=UPI0027831CC2|nr:peptide ABC transporter substrate-binding protein [Variovorax paradoxus]MDQ0025086.1 peptide/nickel transport system substrate-binding protein [Variovorax paradoxus]
MNDHSGELKGSNMKRTNKIGDAPMGKLTRRDAVFAGAATFALGSLGSLGLAARAHAAAPATKPTGQAILGFSQEVTVLHPLMTANEVDQGVWWNLFSPLWMLDAEGKFVPLLAKSVPTLENGGISADGLTWRVELRNDVKWHDGKPMTAEDVKYSINLMKNPAFRARNRTAFEYIASVGVEGDHVITWKLKEPYAPLTSVLSWTFIVPAHILSQNPDPNSPLFAAAPVGTGPFKFVSRKTGDHLILEANPDYFGKGPSLNRLIFKYVPDLNAMYTQFKTGEIDFIGLQGIPANFYKEATALRGRRVHAAPRGAVENLTLNLAHPALADKAVRKALNIAMDRQAICDLVYYGVPKPANNYLVPTHWASNPNLPKPEYDPKKASAMLDQAGWVRGADGIRVKNGVRLSFTNSTTTGNQLRAQTQQLIADDFKKIGVEMLIKNMVAAVLWADFWRNSEFDSLMTAPTYTIASDPDITHRFGSASIPKETKSGSNVSQYKNAGVDTLLARGRQEYNLAKRKEIYAKVQELIMDDLPFLPLFYEVQIEGTKTGLDGYANNVNALANSWNAASWRWTA